MECKIICMIPKKFLFALHHEKIEEDLNEFHKDIVKDIDISEDKYLLMLDGINVTKRIHKLPFEGFKKFFEILNDAVEAYLNDPKYNKNILFAYVINDEIYFSIKVGKDSKITTAYKLISFYLSSFSVYINDYFKKNHYVFVDNDFILFDAKLYKLGIDRLKDFISLRQSTSILCNIEHLYKLDKNYYNNNKSKQYYYDHYAYNDEINNFLLGTYFAKKDHRFKRLFISLKNSNYTRRR